MTAPLDAGYYSLRSAGLRALRGHGLRAALAQASQYLRALLVNIGTLTISDRVRL